jgi:glycosyltransferase involved in cell wall biosynthesis
MNQEITFSIIIPHKNSPELLQRCLNSIPRRKDIQIIVVDDNSDENIVDFKNFPGLGEDHVEVYLTKEGKGAGYARNVGLTHAKGKWFLFADADDFFTENAFEYLFLEIDSPHEIIYFKIDSCYSDTYEKAERDKHLNSFVDNFIKKRKDSDNLIRYNYLVPWGKMIKAELIWRENAHFDEVVATNDVMFSLIIGHFALSISVSACIIYCVTIRKGSITRTRSLEYLTSRYLVALRRNEFLKKKRKKRYQIYIITFLFFSIDYGFRVFLKFIKLSIVYRINPFVGICSYSLFLVLKNRRKKKEMNKNYTISR